MCDYYVLNDVDAFWDAFWDAFCKSSCKSVCKSLIHVFVWYVCLFDMRVCLVCVFDT
jgi:hypothetical protein